MAMMTDGAMSLMRSPAMVLLDDSSQIGKSTTWEESLAKGSIMGTGVTGPPRRNTSLPRASSALPRAKAPGGPSVSGAPAAAMKKPVAISTVPGLDSRQSAASSQ